MNNFEIREFEPPYVTRVQDLLNDIIRKLGFDFSILSTDSDLQDIQANYFLESGRFWLLVENEKLIGTIALKPLQNNCYELKRFFISENYRGKGYGNKALEFIMQYARGKNIGCIKLDTNIKSLRAIHLYKKFGFQEIGPYRTTDKKDMQWFELRL